MSSKSIFLLCLFLAISTLLVISEVAARDLAETSASEKKTDGENGLNDAKYGGNGGYGPGNGGGYGYGPGNGGYGYGPGNGGYGRGGYGPGNGGYGRGNQGRYCRYGCCRRGNYGGGCRVCCNYAGEKAVTVQPEAKPHN